MRGLTSVHGDDDDESGDGMVMMEKSARRNPCGGASWSQQTYLLTYLLYYLLAYLLYLVTYIWAERVWQ